MPRKAATAKKPKPRAPKFEVSAEAKALFSAQQAMESGYVPDKDVGKTATCVRCGARLNDNTGVYMPKGIYPSGFHPMCLTCQQKKYADIAQATSRTYAVFYACIAFDVPYKPEVVAEITANHNGVWYDYVKRVQRPYIGQDNPKIDLWTEGVTDIAEAFGGDLPVLAITGDVMVGNMDELPDEKRWDIEWGDGWTAYDYKQLDNRYMQLTSEWAGAPIPPRTAMSLHDVARYMLLRDKSTMSDNVGDAKKYQDMITAIMASEDLKVDRNRGNEELRIDKIAKWLESRNAIQNGQIVGYDDLVKILAQEHGTYRTSLDVVDQIILCILNTMRKNEGEPEFDKLPISAQVNDFKGELLSEMSDEEKKIMKNLGLTPPEREVR